MVYNTSEKSMPKTECNYVISYVNEKVNDNPYVCFLIPLLSAPQNTRKWTKPTKYLYILKIDIFIWHMYAKIVSLEQFQK